MKRTLGLAAVFFAIVALTGPESRAQNLEAGKSPGQLFSATCTACHRSPRGLLRSVPPSSLPGFLREHYTTSRDMAQQLAGFLIANGATDPRARQDIRTPQEARRDPRTDPRQDPRIDPRADPRGDPRQAQPDGRGGPQPPVAIPQQEPRPAEPQQAGRPEIAVQPDGRAPPAVDPRSREGRRLARQAARDAAASRLEQQQKNRRTRLPPAARIEAVKERGKDAPALGDLVRPAPSVMPAAAVSPMPEELGSPDIKRESAKPGTGTDVPQAAAEPRNIPSIPAEGSPTPALSSVPTRADPVPAVTPAPTPPAETRATPATTDSRPRPADEPSTRPTPAEPSAGAAPAPAAPVPPISQ